MKIILYVILALFSLGRPASAEASTDDAVLQTRFAHERTTLSCFEGSTSEESCGGTGLSVFLRNEQVRHLDWTVETSTQFVRLQYFFDDTSPRLVVESVIAKFDSRAEPLAKPRLFSTKRYRLDLPQPSAKQKALFEHAQFLIADFNRRRKEFARANP